MSGLNPIFYNEIQNFGDDLLEAEERDNEMREALANAKFSPDESYKTRASWLSLKVAYSIKKNESIFCSGIKKIYQK